MYKTCLYDKNQMCYLRLFCIDTKERKKQPQGFFQLYQGFLIPNQIKHTQTSHSVTLWFPGKYKQKFMVRTKLCRRAVNVKRSDNGFCLAPGAGAVPGGAGIVPGAGGVYPATGGKSLSV